MKEVLFNVTALKNKMDAVPKGQRINNFFDGALTQLSMSQLDNLEQLITDNTDDVINHIASCRIAVKLQEENEIKEDSKALTPDS